MKNWRKTLLSPTANIRKAMEVIDSSGLQIALVVSEKGKLLGTITDGDIRRALLKNIPLEASVDGIMCQTPLTLSSDDNKGAIWEKAQIKNIHQIPVINDNGFIIGLETVLDVTRKSTFDNPVVIMAGGMGTRLRPLTYKCPKPMLEVGGKPILETLIENFSASGFHNFHLSVNYMGDLIENHFKDGASWGVSIKYLREEQPLGTAGSLSLLTPTPTLPIIIINGDVLTKVNFKQLLNFHIEHNAVATMCVREYSFQVPYGVAVADNHHLLSVEEKPIHRFLVNAGIYVLNPEILSLIAPGIICDMPTIFEKLTSNKKQTIVFPIHEYWIDLGRIEDLSQAQGDYKKVFE
jgi:dTDP-glucose pyrophosphorylase